MHTFKVTLRNALFRVIKGSRSWRFLERCVHQGVSQRSVPLVLFVITVSSERRRNGNKYDFVAKLVNIVIIRDFVAKRFPPFLV